jgi:hypothetical protein
MCCVFGGVCVVYLISFMCCVFGGVCVVHLISFLCCVFCYFCFVFLSSLCFLSDQCCQCLWIVHSLSPLRVSLVFIRTLKFSNNL